MANLIMGLASQTFARSVAEVSLSPCYHYQYSSINKAIDAFFSSSGPSETGQETAEKRLEAEKKFVRQGGAPSKAL